MLGLTSEIIFLLLKEKYIPKAFGNEQTFDCVCFVTHSHLTGTIDVT